jgi:hypothetical protein
MKVMREMQVSQGYEGWVGANKSLEIHKFNSILKRAQELENVD